MAAQFGEQALQTGVVELRGQLQAAPGPAAPKDLAAVLDQFRPIRSRLVHAVLFIVPGLLLLAVVVRASFFRVWPGVEMYLSSLVAVAAALVIFLVFMGRLKALPKTLWERNSIALADSRGEGSVDIARDYALFIESFEVLLNSRWQFALSTALGILGASWVIFARLTGIEYSLLTTIWELTLAFYLGFILGLPA
jgi:hypothetical protein